LDLGVCHAPGHWDPFSIGSIFYMTPAFKDIPLQTSYPS